MNLERLQRQSCQLHWNVWRKLKLARYGEKSSNYFPFSSSALTFVADELLFSVIFVKDHRIMVEFVGATFLLAFNACVCLGVVHCVAVLTASVANVKILAFLVSPILLKVTSTNGTFAFLGAQPASQWAVPFFL